MTSQIPMDISPNKWDNYCDEKCAYSFKYKTSNTCTVKSYGNYLHLTYDISVPPPVMFNRNSYNVDNIEIYSPSLHLFNGNKADGELIITHTATSIGKPLMVCIPLNSQNTSSSVGTQIITDIINGSSQLQSGGDATNININDYNLTNIVPQTPFYYYEDTNGSNVIIYGLANAITINKSVIDTLQKTIAPVTDVKYPSVEYFEYNKNGPSSGNNNDEIYIDCQPTGNSDETTQVEYAKTATTNDMGSFFNSQIFILIIAALICILLIIIIHKGLVYVFQGSSTIATANVRGGTRMRIK